MRLLYSSKARQEFIASLVLTALIFYFSYHTVSGANGVLAVMQLDQQLEASQAELSEVQAERLALQHRVQMLSPKSLDLDMLDEQARITLGRAKPNEIILLKPR